ncbi:DUF1349 domain-containing protein [Paraflavisolibacter sp. H34]|uniref:DUF1349 domain-containing protein n=1 Tax=Huijunlia imazamoxiresistens TaxID=3127457 RepID=UPI0030167789
MNWHNAPQKFRIDGNTIELEALPKTDFWRITHYGFIRDNGHFLFREAEGDFTASVKVRGDYTDLYDQAGLMIRTDERHWIKTGIEYVHGVQNVSAVVTHECSDWSVAPQQNNPEAIWLKLTRQGDFVEIHYSFDNAAYALLRIAPFPPAVPVQIGLMAAAPEGGGFRVVYEDFNVEPIKN